MWPAGSLVSHGDAVSDRVARSSALTSSGRLRSDCTWAALGWLSPRYNNLHDLSGEWKEGWAIRSGSAVRIPGWQSLLRGTEVSEEKDGAGEGEAGVHATPLPVTANSSPMVPPVGEGQTLPPDDAVWIVVNRPYPSCCPQYLAPELRAQLPNVGVRAEAGTVDWAAVHGATIGPVPWQWRLGAVRAGGSGPPCTADRFCGGIRSAGHRANGALARRLASGAPLSVLSAC